MRKLDCQRFSINKNNELRKEHVENSSDFPYDSLNSESGVFTGEKVGEHKTFLVWT